MTCCCYHFWTHKLDLLQKGKHTNRECNYCVILDACALCVFNNPASVLQAMAVLVCAEMYQVKRLQHLCEVCVCAYLQSMPSRELASTGISVIRLLRRAKVRGT